MKRLILVVLIALLLISADLPPALPSSFWGYVAGAQAGAIVTTNFPGSTSTLAWNGSVVYATNVTGGAEGSEVQFYIDGKLCGNGVYHIGTNQHVDLSCPVHKPHHVIRRRINNGV
jgi:hypothetical protein